MEELSMRDMLVVELVENVLVDVLGIHPETVLPHALLSDDLGATPVDVMTILQRLEDVLPAGAVQRLIPSQAGGRASSFSVDAVSVQEKSATSVTRVAGGLPAGCVRPISRR